MADALKRQPGLGLLTACGTDIMAGADALPAAGWTAAPVFAFCARVAALKGGAA